MEKLLAAGAQPDHQDKVSNLITSKEFLKGQKYLRTYFWNKSWQICPVCLFNIHISTIIKIWLLMLCTCQPKASCTDLAIPTHFKWIPTQLISFIQEWTTVQVRGPFLKPIHVNERNSPFSDNEAFCTAKHQLTHQVVVLKTLQYFEGTNSNAWKSFLLRFGELFRWPSVFCRVAYEENWTWIAAFCLQPIYFLSCCTVTCLRSISVKFCEDEVMNLLYHQPPTLLTFTWPESLLTI